MNCQMILVISSPSSSTTGLATLILDMPLTFLPHTCAIAMADPPGGPPVPVPSSCSLRRSREYESRDQQADPQCGERRGVQQPGPRGEQACAAIWQPQPGHGRGQQDAGNYQRTAPDICLAAAHPRQPGGEPAQHDEEGHLVQP